MDEPDALNVVVQRGAVALARLQAPTFQEEWAALQAACPWATVFQGPVFAAPWLATYGDLWEVAVVEGRSGARLDALLLLARPPAGDWTHLGGIHAEYHAWLARRPDGATVRALLQAARRTLGFVRLRWLFLPPGSPVSALRAAAPATVVRAQPQPVRILAGAPAPGSALRSKRNRLRKRGALTLDRPTGAAAASFLDEFIPMHDARHAAVGHGRAFDLDPRKRAYYQASLAVPGLLDATALRLDGALIAGHIGVRDGHRLVLGMLAHAPAHDADSPGQLLVHELAQAAPADGIEALDLTPGGAYKARFATEFRDAWAVDQAWGWWAAGWLRVRYEVVSPLMQRLRGITVRWRPRR